LVEKPEGRSQWEDLCIDERIILKLILTRMGFIWLRIETNGGALVKTAMNLRETQNANYVNR
jgi:hypothetical protein